MWLRALYAEDFQHLTYRMESYMGFAPLALFWRNSMIKTRVKTRPITRRARWDGTCKLCLAAVRKGDWLKYDKKRSRWVHLRCPQPEQRRTARCPVCKQPIKRGDELAPTPREGHGHLRCIRGITFT